MNEPRRPSPLSRLLPVIVVALVALGAGVLLALRTGDSATVPSAGEAVVAAGDSGAAPDDAAESAALETLQGKLRRSQLLPTDFRTVPPFELGGVDGEPVTEEVLDGRWSAMFFGYTNCPDVCPVTLSVMKDVVDELTRRGEDPMQVLFVTVDPVRDTAARMKDYLAFFDERFIGVTGELADVMALTGELGIVSAFTADPDRPDAYTVDHTASMLLVDPQRRVRARFTAPHEVASIVADYTTIRAALN